MTPIIPLSLIMNHRGKTIKKPAPKLPEKMVGVGRFELPTSCTPSKRASQATLHPEPLERR